MSYIDGESIGIYYECMHQGLFFHEVNQLKGVDMYSRVDAMEKGRKRHTNDMKE